MYLPRGFTKGASSRGDQRGSNERKRRPDAAAGCPERILTDGGQNPGTPLELRYAVSTDVDPVDLLPQAAAGSLDEYLDSIEEDVTVTFADGRMRVEWGAEDGLAAVFDPDVPELVLLHRAESAYTRIERPLDELEPSVEPLEVESTGPEQEFQVGQQRRTARRFDATLDGRRLELWTIRVPERAQAFSRTLWRRLLPGAPKHLYRTGLPAELTIRDPTDAQRSLVHVRLVDWREDPDLSIPPAPPDSYDELEPREQPYPTAASRPAEERGDVEWLFRERESEGPPGPVRSMRTRHALRRGGQDFAAAFDQTVLDEVASGINAVTETFGDFGHGDGGEIDLEIDWFQQLRPHLDFRTSDGEEITDEVLDVLASLLLYKEVTTISPEAPAEEFPPGLTDDEQPRFREALRDAERDPSGFRRSDSLGLDESEARFAYFVQEFSTDRRAELADLYFESLTQPIEQDLHPGEITVDGVVYFELSDFEATLRVGHRPVVDAIEFVDFSVRLDLQFDELALEFDFLTLPGTHWSSVALNFLTLGIFGAAFQANRGWGLVEYDDVHVVVYLTPWPVSYGVDYIGMDVSVDQEASAADGFLFLNGVNLSASAVELIYAGIGSRLDESLLTDRFFGAIEDGLREAVREDLSEFLNWPDFWPGFWDPDPDMGRPLGVGSAALVDPGSAIFEGDLIGGSPSMAREVDTPGAETLDYVLAERYLEEWLRGRLPTMIDGETHRDPAPFADVFGVSLPDPRSLPGADDPVDFEEMPTPPGIGCDSPPMTPDAEFENRLVIERRLPSVDLPEEGERDRAGILNSRYRLRVEAVRRDYVARPRLVEEPCPPSDEDEESGPAPIPLSPRGRANRQRAFALGRAGQPAFGGFAGSGFRERGPGVRGGGGGPGSRGGGVGFGSRGGGIGPGVRGGRPGAGGAFDDPSGDDGDGAGPPCPMPYCEWEIEASEKTLETYLDATVRVTGDLYVGFAADGSEIWLPELALYLAEDSDGNPDVDGVVRDLSVAGPLADPDRDDVESVLARMAVEDALILLEEMPNPDPPQTTYRLAPTEDPGVHFALDRVFLDRGIDSDIHDDIREILRGLVTYDQSGGTESLQYTVDGGLLYWPIEAEQSISEHIS